MDSTVNLASEFRASIAAASKTGLVGVGDDAGISLAGRLAEAIDACESPTILASLAAQYRLALVELKLWPRQRGLASSDPLEKMLSEPH